MTRFVSLLRSSSLLAASAIAMSACATYDERPAPRHGSIKDTMSAAPVPKSAPVRAAARVQRATYQTVAPTTHVQVFEVPIAPQAPAPRLPAIDTPPPAVRIVVEPPAAKIDPPAKAAALEQRPVAASPALQPTPKSEPAKPEAPKAEPKPLVVEPPKVTTVTPEPAQATPPRPAVVIKPAETRPTVEPRRQPSDVAAKPAPIVPPAVVAVPPTPQAPAAQPGPPKAEVKPETKIAALTEDQRVAEVLGRAETYLKAGRYQDARTSLQDAAKSGNPRVLVALAETYDTLILREQYPRLSRTGDAERAISIYEQAKAAGAKDVDARITALKALAGPKR